ncbi:hypothetical protein [Angustibacter luteus]|uniref:XRE family transcriptional regulator n=1 Tax=Angustibacter luteus TaxID=658456 RepID=A0ABW1JFT4_9ACTN
MSEQTLPDELTRLLEHGPFHEALAAAVANRGLTLARLQHHLALRASPVSVPTLSCWVRGTRQPERPQSRQALAELEGVLGLPPRALSDLLGRPRRRGRDAARPIADAELWQPSRSLHDALRELDLPRPDLRVVSVHVRQTVDERGVERELRHVNVMESTKDDTDRMRVTIGHLAGSTEATRLRAVTGAQTGRLRRTPDGFLVAELLLDATLAKGGRTIVEYAVQLDAAGAPSTECTALFHRPVRQCLVEVFFDPDRLPARGFALRRPAGKHEQRVDVPLSSAGVLRTALFDQPAGEYGLTWQWPA